MSVVCVVAFGLKCAPPGKKFDLESLSTSLQVISSAVSESLQPCSSSLPSSLNMQHGIKRHDTRYRPAVPSDIIVAVCLRRLATGDLFFDLAHEFGVSVETARSKSNEFNSKIKEVLYKKVVKLPTGPELKRVMKEFFETRGLPNCCFCMDGTHIPWRCSQSDHAEFECYKKFTSINAQLVCDKRGTVMSMSVGTAGGTCDATVFRHSGFAKRLEEKEWPSAPAITIRGVSIPPYGVCDGIYPCKPYLLKPYRGADIYLSPIQRLFNYSQSSTRQPIEHVNGMLKRRWRILSRMLELWSVDDAINTICCCVILHNQCATPAC